MSAMFALKFDDKMRAARAKGIEYKKIDTVYENTPEFEALWASYQDIISDGDLYYHILTEDDGRTHTFFRIVLPEDKTDDNEEGEADGEAA